VAETTAAGASSNAKQKAATSQRYDFLQLARWLLKFIFHDMLKKPGDFTVPEGHGYSLVYLYNILGWSFFQSIHPSHHPSRKFLIPEEEDDGTKGRRRLMTTAAVYPQVHVILLA
jgi:hypothetical protein